MPDQPPPTGSVVALEGRRDMVGIRAVEGRRRGMLHGPSIPGGGDAYGRRDSDATRGSSGGGGGSLCGDGGRESGDGGRAGAEMGAPNGEVP
jgi:hypothetical protein